jgi:hypothetical protein
LLLEHEILGDHGSHATGATELRCHNGEVQHGDHEALHARVSVGQTPGATQRCSIHESARELAIRDPHVLPAMVRAWDGAIPLIPAFATAPGTDLLQ